MSRPKVRWEADIRQFPVFIPIPWATRVEREVIRVGGPPEKVLRCSYMLPLLDLKRLSEFMDAINIYLTSRLGRTRPHGKVTGDAIK